MKILFMGTPQFAAESLAKLLEKHEIVAVVTQPDKKKGRGNKMQYPPVKELALANGIEVLQPVKIKDPSVVETLKNYHADLFVVAAYGQILSQEILDIPPLGCICVHASLLPQYRGAAPIQWAIIDGCTETGVTIMQMERGIDTGDMFSKVFVPIEKTDTFETLQNKLADVGGQLLLDTIPSIEAGDIEPQKQNDAESTYAKMISKEMGHLSFEQSTEQLLNWVRGLNPWPSAYVYYGEEILKIWTAESYTLETTNGAVGEIVQVLPKEGFVVKTKDGALLIQEVQGASGKRMKTTDYMRGRPVLPGTILQ